MKISFILLIMIFSFKSIAEPGGWVSSGGEVFQFSKNPWFVKNTKQVYYCVQFSNDEFSTDLTTTKSLIRESLQYWKNEFSGNFLNLSGSNIFNDLTFEVANQDFVLNDYCQGSEDLVFKFGYQTLNDEEIKYLEKPSKYLGVTIRKEYDNLKGKGIIFISGDLGKNSYELASEQTVAQAWRYPKLLKYVIIHELGHVFGVPHTGSGLMSEVFLDQLLFRKIAALYVREPIMSFVKPASEVEICDSELFPQGSQSFIASYFKLDSANDCLRFQLHDSKDFFEILAKKKNDTQSLWTKIGQLNINKSEITDFSLRPAVFLQLPANQTVFTTMGTPFKIGPVFQNLKVDGHITFNGSMKPYSVQVDLSPDAFVLFGIHENKIRQVFKFGNPLLYTLFSPF